MDRHIMANDLKKRFMDTVLLSDGSRGYVLSKYETEEDIRYKCNVCQRIFTEESTILHHTSQSMHLEKMRASVHPAEFFKQRRSNNDKQQLKEDTSKITKEEKPWENDGIIPGEPLPPGMEDVIEKVCHIQKTIDNYTGPLIGIEYLVELVSTEEAVEPKYICMLCDKKGDPRNIVCHLSSFLHCFKYISCFFRSAGNIINLNLKNSNTRRGFNIAIRKITEAIQNKFGRLKPTMAAFEKFEQQKNEILSSIVKQEHFRESPTCTFLEYLTEDKIQEYIEQSDAELNAMKNKNFNEKEFILQLEKDNDRSHFQRDSDFRFFHTTMPYSELTDEDINKSIEKKDINDETKASRNRIRSRSRSRGRRRSPLRHRTSPRRRSPYKNSYHYRSRSGSRSREHYYHERDLHRGTRDHDRIHTGDGRSRLKDRSRYEDNRGRNERDRRRRSSSLDRRRRSTSLDRQRRSISAERRRRRSPHSSRHDSSSKLRKEYLAQNSKTQKFSQFDSKMDDYRKKLHDLEVEMDSKLKYYQCNPEKHPQYPEEWKLFWNRRYKELQQAGKDPTGYDFKPEWILFWDGRVKELHDKELADKKEELKSLIPTNINSDLEVPSPTSESSKDVTINVKNSQNVSNAIDIQLSRTPNSRPRSPLTIRSSPLKLKARSPSPTLRSRSPLSKRSPPHKLSARSPLSKKSPSPSFRSLLPTRSPSPRSRSPLPKRSSPRKLRAGSPLHKRSSSRNRSPFPKKSLSPVSKPRSPVLRRSPSPREQRLISSHRKPKTSNVPLVVHCLRMLSVLEQQLGSLGPRALELLSQAILMEKVQCNGSLSLLQESDIHIFFETAKEKIRGQLIAGIVERQLVGSCNSVIHSIESMLASNPLPTKPLVHSKPVYTPIKPEPVQVEGVGLVNKMAIAQQIAEVLVAQGRTDVSQQELEELINAVVGIASTSNANPHQPSASFIAQLNIEQSKASSHINNLLSNLISSAKEITSSQGALSGPVVATRAASPNNSMDISESLKQYPQFLSNKFYSDDTINSFSDSKAALLEQSLSNSVAVVSPEENVLNPSSENSVLNDEELCSKNLLDDQLKVKLIKFKHLSRDEQKDLIELLKKLERTDPERVEKLRNYVSAGISQDMSPTKNVTKPEAESVRLSPLSSTNISPTPEKRKKSIQSKDRMYDEDEDYNAEDVYTSVTNKSAWSLSSNSSVRIIENHLGNDFVQNIYNEKSGSPSPNEKNINLCNQLSVPTSKKYNVYSVDKIYESPNKTYEQGFQNVSKSYNRTTWEDEKHEQQEFSEHLPWSQSIQEKHPYYNKSSNHFEGFEANYSQDHLIYQHEDSYAGIDSKVIKKNMYPGTSYRPKQNDRHYL